MLAAVLAGTGVFLDLRFAAEMNHAIDQSLRARAGDVIVLVGQADSGLRQARPVGLNTGVRDFAQVLDTSGKIFDSSPQTGRHAVLSAGALPRSGARGVFIDRASVAGLVGPVRMLAVPVRAQGRNLVVVVGTTLSDRDRALGNLRTLLLIGGAGALMLSALAGFLAIGRALRPIELMRRRAEEIGAAEPGSRLPVPPSGDEVARLGGTLNSMLDRLEDALLRERTFVIDASHELRGPLAVLKTELELALRIPEGREALEAAIRSAAEETDRLAQLAEDLLVIARGEQGHLPVTRSRLDTRELLRGVRDRFAKRARELGRSILVSAPEATPIYADRAWNGAGSWQHDRERTALWRRRHHALGERQRRQYRAARQRLRLLGSTPISCRTRSDVSLARMPAVRPRAPASASRSSPRSQLPTKAPRM